MDVAPVDDGEERLVGLWTARAAGIDVHAGIISRTATWNTACPPVSVGTAAGVDSACSREAADYYQIMECTDYEPDARRFPTPAERLRLQVWPDAAAPVEVVKRWREPEDGRWRSVSERPRHHQRKL